MKSFFFVIRDTMCEGVSLYLHLHHLHGGIQPVMVLWIRLSVRS